jgi:hypothetical protein
MEPSRADRALADRIVRGCIAQADFEPLIDAVARAVREARLDAKADRRSRSSAREIPTVRHTDKAILIGRTLDGARAKAIAQERERAEAYARRTTAVRLRRMSVVSS